MLIFTLTATLSIIPAFSVPEQANSKAKEMTVFSIPENAVQIAPGIYSLGTIQSNGVILEGIMSLHHRDGHTGGRGGGSESETVCYSYTFGKPLQWRELENWIVDPSNNKELDENKVVDTLNASIIEWEFWAEADILGSGTVSSGLEADYDSTDGKNEIYFADIRNQDGSLNNNILGVTITWAVVNGPPFARGIVEMDQVYDDNDFEWSTEATVVAGKFDFGHVATHEMGHGIGMGHTSFDDQCKLETMYPTAAPADIQGRTLHDGDIAGIQKLY